MLFIHEILTKSSRDNPNKEAFVYKDRRFTFKEIDEASTKVANFLVSQGVRYGDRIGIFSSKNIEEIIALFAIMKIGCIFVHINPHYKEDQLSHVISNCDIKALFVHNSKAKVLNTVYPNKNPFNLIVSLSPKINLEYDNVQYLGRIFEEASPTEISSNELKENDPAAIIYTSGSTGKPKGIIVTHKIFYDSTVASAHVLENREDDRLISVTPFSFDGALSQLFTSIFVGGALILQESNFPKDIVNTMLTERITGFHAVPSFWRMLLQKHSPLAKYDYPCLRYISIIGEVFPRSDLMRLKAILTRTKFFMMYGTTEAFRSTFLHPDDFEKKTSSVGKPFPGVEIVIVDDHGRICDSGEIGEIVHKGAFVSPGYWDDPVKTSKVFRRNAIYTGDLGKIDDEGYLYFVGRKDAMIKSSGYRISPEEIEECLYKMMGISKAVVIGAPDEEYGNKIKAIVSCTNDHTLTQKDVINHCKRYLPYYMIPSIVEFRTDLPKTGTYKINRSQLS